MVVSACWIISIHLYRLFLVCLHGCLTHISSHLQHTLTGCSGSALDKRRWLCLGKGKTSYIIFTSGLAWRTFFFFLIHLLFLSSPFTLRSADRLNHWDLSDVMLNQLLSCRTQNNEAQSLTKANSDIKFHMEICECAIVFTNASEPLLCYTVLQPAPSNICLVLLHYSDTGRSDDSWPWCTCDFLLY